MGEGVRRLTTEPWLVSASPTSPSTSTASASASVADAGAALQEEAAPAGASDAVQSQSPAGRGGVNDAGNDFAIFSNIDIKGGVRHLFNLFACSCWITYLMLSLLGATQCIGTTPWKIVLLFLLLHAPAHVPALSMIRTRPAGSRL